MFYAASAFADATLVITSASSPVITTPVETDGYSMCLCQVSTPDGATATLTVEGSSTSTGPWNVMATLSFSGTATQYYSGVCPTWFRLNLSAVSGGTVNATRELRK